MEETPVQIRVLTDGRPSGRLFYCRIEVIACR